MQLIDYEKLRITYTKGRKLSGTDMFSQSSTRKKLQLNHLRHKLLHQRLHFATLTHDNQTKTVHYLVKLETVVSFTEIRLLTNFSWFRKRPIFPSYHFKMRKNDIKTTGIIFIWSCEIFPKSKNKPIKKDHKIILQNSAIFNDTSFTDNDDSVEKKVTKNDDSFHLDLSLRNLPSTSEKCKYSENEHLQLQTNHETF